MKKILICIHKFYVHATTRWDELMEEMFGMGSIKNKK